MPKARRRFDALLVFHCFVLQQRVLLMSNCLLLGVSSRVAESTDGHVFLIWTPSLQGPAENSEKVSERELRGPWLLLPVIL